MISLLTLAALLASGGVVIALDLGWICYAVVATLGIVAIGFSGKSKFSVKFAFSGLILAVLLIVTAIGRGDAPVDGSSATIIGKIAICMILAQYFLMFDVRYVVSKMVLLFESLLFLSLITFVILNVAPDLTITLGKTTLGNSVKTFLGVGFFRQNDFVKYGLVRNQSVFWEPGVFGFFITFFFLLKIYVCGATNRIWLYVIALLTTLSAGAIPMFLLAAGNFYYMRYIRRTVHGAARMALDAILISLIFLLVIFAIWGASDPDALLELLGAIFHRNFATDSSTSTRTMDLIYGFRSAIEMPFFGHGNDLSAFYQLTTDELNISKEWYDGGITNSIIQIFYKYGAVFLLYYLYLLWRFAAYLEKSHAPIIFIVLILMLMHEPLHFSLITLYFLLFASVRSRRHGATREPWSPSS